MKQLSLKGALVAVLPSLVALALYYSLAVHMYLSLGRWPDSIGDEGFSAALSLHAKTQFWCTIVLVMTSVCLWPLAMVACAAIPKTRRLIPYLAIFAVALVACYGLMQLAPKPFLNWWLD